MLRSMYAGVSGMKGFQTKLDVIGNNIANVNTTGYKKGRAVFQDMMSQSVAGASAPTATRGGINPRQVGTGVQLGAIDTIHTQGNRQSTERPLDLQLEGDGMFIFEEGNDLFYSRAGNFYLDNNGDLVNANGQYVLGFAGDVDENENVNIDTGTVGRLNIPNNAESISIQQDGVINYLVDGKLQVAGQIALSKFSNEGGLEKVGANMYRASVNDGQMDGGNAAGGNYADFGAIFYAPDVEGTAKIIPGALEMSNVDLAEEFTEMITAQRGFQANTRIVTTSDEILQELVNLKR